MFTGIVEEAGLIEAIEVEGESARLKVRAGIVLSDTKEGDSIAVAGVCLTVTGLTKTTFFADIMRETMARTRLGELSVGDRVNLERAMRADARLGGHIVTGHVDALGTVASIEEGPAWTTIVFQVPADLAKFCAPQGSIAVEGVSLTIAGARGDLVEVGLIPATLEITTLGGLEVGDKVNLETDILAKHIARLIDARISR